MIRRTPRNELLRRARQHARDGATAPLLGGFRRSGKVVEVRIDDDQAADLIASLPDATGPERTAILDRLARAGIFEAIPSTPSESRCEALPIFHGSDASFEPGPCGLVAGDPSVSGPDGTIPFGPTSTPTPIPSAPLEGSSPAGVVVEALPSAAASAPSDTACAWCADDPNDRGPRGECACTDTGRPTASDSGSFSGASPRAEPVEPTSTPPSPAAAAGGAVCDPTANAEQAAPPRTRKQRSDKGRKRGPKITATPEVSGTAVPDAVQGEVGSVTDGPVASNHYAGGLPGSVLDRASKGDVAAQTDLAKPEAWLTDEEFERAPLTAEALPITTPLAVVEELAARAEIDRRSYIGSADAPATLGLSPHSTPWDVFARKVGAVDDKGGEWLEMGLDLEPIIAKWAAKKLEATSLDKGVTLIHPEETWAGATIDYLADLPSKERAIVECKALGLFSPWRDDEVPLHIVGQVHWQCGIARAVGLKVDRLFVARFKGLAVDVFEVRYEPALFAAMLAKCKAFWAQVQSKTPPPIDGSSSAKAWLDSIYPSAKKALRPATDAEVFTVTQYVVARDQAGAAKKRQDAAANEIRALIGDAEGVIGGGVVAKWTGKEGAARRLDVRAVTGKGDE